MIKFSFLAKSLLAAGSLALSLNAFAIKPFYATEDGAIKGYDPVAYFVDHKAVKGEKNLSYVWQETTWYFASQANLNAFKAEPEKYAPQYGGYCAYGVSFGYAPSVDPTAYSIVDGKLYLNYSHNVSQKWEKESSKYIDVANQKWPAVKAGNVTEKN